MKLTEKNGPALPDLHTKITTAGLLVTLGVVYGDIGTSPLYVMKSLIAGNGGLNSMSESFILGSISLIFWTLTIITSIKYVGIALRADNHGEGGIFALYTLVRHQGRWLIIPAIIGGATLLADGTLTPTVTVTTAIEGLKNFTMFGTTPITTQKQVIIITILIITFLFFIQRFGTHLIGVAFGPIMLIWFSFLGIVGIIFMSNDWSILRALSPYYGIQLLTSGENKQGLFILGSIFLATTGAEALYSDMGHVGRNNIYGSWPFVKICLVLNYFGQGAWILTAKANHSITTVTNPFFEMLPGNWRIFGIIIATLAAIIASQALISGSFTLVAEAIKLKVLPRLHIIYPTNFKGQLYIPTINAILWVACVSLVLFFQNSANMEGAYGLAITMTMLMTTLLLFQFLRQRKFNPVVCWAMLLFFGSLELIFFLTSLVKFEHGGYVTILIATVILLIMGIWRYGSYLKNNNAYHTKSVSIIDYKKQLKALRHDPTIPLYTTNLVYMNRVSDESKVKKEILYSILDKRPKKATVYWFVTVNVTDEPYTTEYTTDMFDTDYLVDVQLYLGFRISQNVNVFLRQIINDLMNTGVLPKQPQSYTTMPHRNVGDFAFVLINDDLSPATEIHGFKRQIIQYRLWIEKLVITPARWFGLEYSDVVEERVPLQLSTVQPEHLTPSNPDHHEAGSPDGI